MISAVLITKNEEANIEDCLKSVLFLDEVIVIDAKSTDRTVEIVKKYTSKVIVKEWSNFAEQKNYGINLAKNNWIINIDADERISLELANEIIKIKDSLEKEENLNVSPVRNIISNGIRGYKIPVKNYYFDKFLKHGGFYPDFHLRLFDKRYGKFESRIINVHEGLHIAGEIRNLPKGHIIHYAYKNIKNYFYKFNKYTTMEAQGYFNNRFSPTGYNLIIKPLHRFVKNYIIKAGFLDGISGFLACIFFSFYIFVVELKLIEYYRFNNTKGLFVTLFKRRRKI